MTYITLNKIAKYKDKTIILKGWLYNKRSSGKIAFLQFRDGTGMIQVVVVKSEVDEKTFEMVKGLTLESSIQIIGKVVEDKRSPSGFEIQASDIKLVQQAPDDYPIGKKEHGPDFLLSNRHLWLRSSRQWALLKIRSRVFQAVEEFYRDLSFTKIDTPILTPNACEGTTTLFELDYFGRKRIFIAIWTTLS